MIVKIIKPESEETRIKLGSKIRVIKLERQAEADDQIDNSQSKN